MNAPCWPRRGGAAALLCASAWLAGCAAGPVAHTPAAGLAAPVYALDPGFPSPSGVSFNTVSWIERDPRTGQVLVLQRATPVLSTWTPGGTLVSAWWGVQSLGDPHSVSLKALPGGGALAWVTDMAPPQPAGPAYGHCLKAFTLAGSLVSTIGTCAADSQGTGLDPVQFDKVTDVAWDAAGHLLVTDGDLGGLNNRVLQLTPTGQVLASWSAPGDQSGSGPGQFNLPHAVVVDRCNRLWVADALNHRVQVLAADGTFLGQLTSFGALGVYALAFGASFDAPPLDVLFVGASPTTGGGTGTVSLFAVPMDCAQPRRGALAAFASFDVPLPASASTTLLHAMAVDPVTWDVYLALLGSDVAPQKWVAAWPAGRPPPSREAASSPTTERPSRKDEHASVTSQP